MAQIPLRVEGELTIYTAAALKPTLLTALSDNASLELDLSSVSEMDSAGLQLLLLLKREANRLNHSVKLSGSNSVIDEVLELCNLSGFLEATTN